MLRLKPSEITLTSADIEETTRRMNRREAAAVSAKSRFKRSPWTPQLHHIAAPRVVRGPQHRQEAAITRLGNIPLLQPQTAVHSFADEDSEAEALQSVDSQHDNRNTSIGEETMPALTSPSSLPKADDHLRESFLTPARRLQLPFRTLYSERTVGARLTPGENTEAEAPPSPPKHRFGFSVFGRTRTSTSDGLDEDTIPGPPATDGFTDIKSIISHPIDGVQTATRTSIGRKNSSCPPSSVREGQAVTASLNKHTEHSHVEQLHGRAEPLATTLVHGRFASPEQYVFQEHSSLPHTEPRQRPWHLRTGSQISSSAARDTPSVQAYISRDADESSTEHDFWTAPTTERSSNARPQLHGREDEQGTQQESGAGERTNIETQSSQIAHQEPHHGLLGSPRSNYASQAYGATAYETLHISNQRVSETSSSSSLPYSYYELPVSRHSSSNHTQSVNQLDRSQYDGAAPSRHVGRGAYYSVRPSQVRPRLESPMRLPPVRVSSFSSPNLTAALIQHGVSPLPTSPYTRLHGAQSSPRPSTGLLNPNDFIGEDRDAASAAARDLPSPLDLLEQRAASYLSRFIPVPQETSHHGSRPPSLSHLGARELRHTNSRRLRTSDSSGIRQISGNSSSSRTRTRYREGPFGVWDRQRSSENIPANISNSDGHPIIHPGPQHRQSLRLRQNHPRRAARRTSLRGGGSQASPPPLQFNTQTQSSPGIVHAMITPLRLPVNSGTPPSAEGLRSGVHMLSAEAPHGREDRVRHQELLHRPRYIHLPSLDQNAINAGGPSVVRATASRSRLTPQQQNQENSGEAEAAMMRAELSAVGIRYVDNSEQLDVMDETPPRLGRFERLMGN